MTPILHHAATLASTPEEAFGLFTTPEGLTRWLCAEAEVEPRVGGRYELFWDPSDRAHDCTRGCKVTALVPGRLIAFDWRGGRDHEAFMNAADPLTHVTVSFHAVEAGCEVHLVHAGWRRSPEWEAAWTWFETAWSRAFEQLVEVAGAPASV